MLQHRRVFQPIVSEGCTDKQKRDAQANKWGQTASSAAADLQQRIKDSAAKSTKNFLQACTDHTRTRIFLVHVAARQCSATESASVKQQKSESVNPHLSLQACTG